MNNRPTFLEIEMFMVYINMIKDNYIIFSDPYLSFFWSDTRVSLRDASLSLNPLLKNGIQPRAITLSIPSHLSSGDTAHLLWSVIESSEMSLSCPPS